MLQVGNCHSQPWRHIKLCGNRPTIHIAELKSEDSSFWTLKTTAFTSYTFWGLVKESIRKRGSDAKKVWKPLTWGTAIIKVLFDTIQVPEFPEVTMKIIQRHSQNNPSQYNHDFLQKLRFPGQARLLPRHAGYSWQPLESARQQPAPPELELKAREGREASRCSVSDGLPKQAGSPPQPPGMSQRWRWQINVRKIKSKKQTSYKTSRHFFRP